MNNISKSIGENIRLLRKERGLSQEQLALRADINTSYMGQVERGEKNPTIDVLSKIANALSLPLDKLVQLEMPASALETEQEGYAEKIAHQLNGLSLKEQEAVYKFVKQLVHFKELG